MKIRNKLLILNSIAILSLSITGIYSLSVNKKIANKFEGGDENFRLAVNGATKFSGYAKRAEGHLMLFLALNDPSHREKFFQRVDSLEEQISIVADNTTSNESKKILEEAKVEFKKLQPSGEKLLTAYYRSIAENGKFEMKQYEDSIQEFHDIASTLREQGVIITELETEFLNKQQAITAANEISSYVKRAEGHLMLFFVLEKSQDRDKFFQRLASIQEQIVILNQTLNDPKSKEILESTKAKTENFKQVGEKLLAEYERDIAENSKFEMNQHSSLILEFDDLANSIREDGENISILLTDLQSANKRSIIHEVSILQRNILLSLILTIAVTGVLAYFQSKNISDSISQLNRATNKIAKGDLDVQITNTTHDEIGELAHNFQLMSKRIKQLLQEQKNVAQQQSQSKEQLETAIYTLINEVSEATEGDLTVRSNLDSLELSTVADLFNAIIDNLQEIAIEVKKVTHQVGYSLKENESAIMLLAEQAVAESKETQNTLVSVEQMSQSIEAVAENANQAEKIADDTYNTIVSSTNNMDLTVQSILDLRTTVGETAKKMKRLQESSQKIAQAVFFIQEIALKTNVLAINARVEARLAGEYGEGFTIIAEQVGALAKESTAATREIANIVAAIQGETQEVNQAMESSIVQVLETTNLVEYTKQSLGLVLEKSQQINQLMGSISEVTVSQANTAQNVTHLMQKIAHLSEVTSISSKKVALSIINTAQVAQKLEATVAKFKVAESS
ncbi:MAG: methyl-accepting chemotaxis protein [Xenococcaceae cyanobacterium MO_167.B27]|nr:methyl-accepting chemotaxis protein [Xenococcaceae cyanobacterium MO_167.B27]